MTNGKDTINGKSIGNELNNKSMEEPFTTLHKTAPYLRRGLKTVGGFLRTKSTASATLLSVKPEFICMTVKAGKSS